MSFVLTICITSPHLTLSPMSYPKAELGALPHADGSVNYSWQSFELVGTVNGPIEVQRRDELPEEAFIEVNIRPANGTGAMSRAYTITQDTF